MTSPVVLALRAGLASTVVATIVPYLERDTLTDHVRAGYPDYPDARIDTAVTTYLVLLTIVGVLAAVGWLATVRAVRRGRPWARLGATALLVLGAGVAVTGLLTNDTSGDTGLPPAIGWVGVLPCVPGLLAVGLLWRGSARRQRVGE